MILPLLPSGIGSRSSDVLFVALFFAVLIAGVDADQVRFDNRRFLAESIFEHRFDDRHVDAEQIGQRADINHVALFGAQRRSRDQLGHEFVRRKADVLNPVALQRRRKRCRVIVQKHPAIAHAIDVFRCRSVVEHHHHVDDILAAHIAVAVGANLVPSGQALNVRREHIFR